MAYPLPTLVQQYLANSGLGDYIAPWLNQQNEQMSPIEQPQFSPAPRQEPRTPAPMQEPQFLESPALTAAQQQSEAPVSPIAAGVMEAKKTPLNIKERIALSPQQKEQAVGNAMINFGHNMANSQSPTTSTLGRIAENLGPALIAYQQGLGGAQQSNIDMMKLENEAENTMYERERKNKELENATKKADAYNKYMTMRAERRPVTEAERRQQQNLIKNTATHINKFRQQDLKEAKKELQEMRVNGVHVRSLPPEQRKLIEEQFWAEKNASYNNTIAPYIDILKKNHALGMDVKGIDFKTGKEIIDENYEEPEEYVPAPDKEEVPQSFTMNQQTAQPPQQTTLPPPGSLTSEQRKAILANAKKGK